MCLERCSDELLNEDKSCSGELSDEGKSWLGELLNEPANKSKTFLS